MTSEDALPLLHPLLERNLAQMGYHTPRPIQAAVRRPLFEGRDVIGLARTGTGKTAAFAAPLLHHLMGRKPVGRKGEIVPEQRLRALALCPTRELAQQVQRETARIAQGSVLRTVCVFGKAAIAPQAQAIARGVDIVIGTPGRVLELVEAGRLSLAHVRHMVIDEGDRMLDMGFLPQVQQILDRVLEPRQIALFSATMPREIETLANRILREPVRIEIGRHTTPVEHVLQRMIVAPDAHKMDLLVHLLGEAKRRGVLIFCRTRRRVGWVGEALRRHEIKVGLLHGDRSQAQRTQALREFSDGKLHVLVATDVMARGLHIPPVKTVINYDLPNEAEEYVHRIGRAAHGLEGAPRASKGEAITLLDPDERLKWRAILDVTGIEVFAESAIEGWAAPAGDARRRAPARAKEAEDDDEPRRPKRARRKRGRSHANKPIRTGEKPGGGVRRVPRA